MKHGMRRFFIAFTFLLIAQNVTAGLSKTPSFYLGAQVGYGDLAYDEVTLPVGAQPSFVDETGLAPAFEVGYDFANDWSAELGVIYFHKPKFHDVGVNAELTGKIKNNLIYLAPRWGFSFKERFFAYLKAGVGYVVRDSIISGRETVLQSGEFVRPVYGVGLIYTLDAHWRLESSWVHSPENLSVQVPMANFFGMGATYQFS